MEPIYIRELAAWALVLGLVVILATSRIKEKQKSSKSSVKKESKPVVRIESTPKGPNPFPTMLEESDEPDPAIWDDIKAEEPEFIETPPSRDYKESGSANKEVADVPSKPSRKGSKRRGADKVPGSSDRPTKVRDRKTSAKDGSASHKRQKRTA